MAVYRSDCGNHAILVQVCREKGRTPANDFAAEYSELLQKARAANDAVIGSVTDETLADTKRYRDFKAAGTKGIAECKIRSIILPLLADHVLREANHYIRLLEQVR